MNLNDWATKSKDQQRQLIVQWYKNQQWHVYENIALRAARDLQEELKSSSEVTGVEITGGTTIEVDEIRRVCELVLNVNTTLRESNQLKYSSDHFLGFNVQQTNLLRIT
jgi:hypothetical protein